jgi:hypothetical protein
LDTVRAQNWTVPVALTPKFADPGDADADAAGEELEDEQPAAAAVASAVADKSASVLRFMCRFLQDMVGAKAQRVPERPTVPGGRDAGHDKSCVRRGHGACGHARPILAEGVHYVAV